MEKKIKICELCKGKGTRLIQQGNLYITQTCFACKGRGTVKAESQSESIRQLLNLVILI